MWLRLCGMLLGILGFFFFQAARSCNQEFLRWGSQARLVPIVFLTAFVAFGLESPLVLACGILDVVTGLLTLLALRTAVEQDSSKRMPSASQTRAM